MSSTRISRHLMFMEIARIVAKRSTCFRLNVGAIIVSGGKQIVSIGYNGQQPGDPHCSSPCAVGECNTVHAEANALRNLRWPVHAPADLYVTDSPCIHCAKIIEEKLIQAVFFQSEYRDTAPLHYLMSNGIDVYRVLPNGSLLSIQTGRVVDDLS